MNQKHQATGARATRMIRLLGAALASALLLGLFPFATPPAAEAGPGTHPVYDDGGTLRWYPRWDEAQRVARRERTLILVDVSPPKSPACAGVIGLIRDPAIRNRVAALAVGHHVDSGARSPLIGTFRRNLPSGSHLPWMGFLTPDGAWVSGFAPAKRTNGAAVRRSFLRALDKAEALQKKRGGQVLAGRSTGSSSKKPRTSSTRESTPAKSKPTPKVSSTRGSPQAEPKPASQPKTTPARKPSGRPGELIWYEQITEVRALAQAQGKIILVTSTKPSCSLCKKLREKIVPQVWRDLSRGCICYVYDITKPESRSVDRLVRSNHPNARLMPLSGFITPDGRWLEGFYGSTEPSELKTAYRSALRKR